MTTARSTPGILVSMIILAVLTVALGLWSSRPDPVQAQVATPTPRPVLIQPQVTLLPIQPIQPQLTPLRVLPVAPCGGDIAYGEEVEGTVVRNGRSCRYAFSGRIGDVVTIAVKRLDDSLDPMIDLVGPNNRVIASDDDSGGNYNSLIRGYRLTQTGTYVIVVRPVGDQNSGRFVLSLSNRSAPRRPTPTPTRPPTPLPTPPLCGGRLSYGVRAAGRILSSGQECRFTFEGQAGDVVTIAMNSVDSDLDPWLDLIDPRGNLEAADDDSGGDRDSLIRNHRLRRTGTYTVVARSYEDQSAGRFELFLSGRTTREPTRTPTPTPAVPPVCGKSIDYGDVVIDLLPFAGATCRFDFDGSAGDVVTIRMKGGQNDEIDPIVQLLRPDGRVAASDDDSGGDRDSLIHDFRLPVSGRYVIEASSYQGQGTGSFALSLGQRVACGSDISGADVVYGELTNTVKRCAYTMRVSPQVNYQIAMAGFDDQFDAWLEVWDADGNMVTQNDDLESGTRNSGVGFKPNRTTTYTIIATSYQAGSTGPFELSINTWSYVTLTLCGGHIDYGDSMAGTILLEGTVCEYTFEGTAGDRVRIDMDQVSGDLDPSLELLLDPDDAPLASNENRTAGDDNSTIRYRLPGTDTYLIRARAYDDASTGQFTLSLEKE